MLRSSVAQTNIQSRLFQLNSHQNTNELFEQNYWVMFGIQKYVMPI